MTSLARDMTGFDKHEATNLLWSRFFPLVLTDLASFHALTLVAISHYSNAQGSKTHVIDLAQIRGLAIDGIISALQNSRRAISDQVIIAVAKMALYEAISGNHDIFKTHMKGLAQMVDLRGGLSSLGLEGLLRRILLWVDSNAARLTGSLTYLDTAALESSAQRSRPSDEYLGSTSIDDALS